MLATSTARVWLVVSTAVLMAVGQANAVSPTAQQALKLMPVQEEADFSRPSTEEIAECKISAQKTDSGIGWIVIDPSGMTLRKFVDTNADNVVDRWCYYKNGLEVYRDIDADFDGKADQYRWFHTAGCRWGLDKDEDGQIDSWKAISAEEVTAEVIAALATRDSKRFARLMLTPAELKSLGLGEDKATSLAKKISAATAEFKTVATGQKVVASGSKWLQFSGTRPGTVPAGTDGSSKDLRVYENVIAIVETNGKHDQVQIGTLVNVDDLWRLIDLPPTIVDGQADTAAEGLFFQASLARHDVSTGAADSNDGHELLSELEKLDQAAEKATAPAELAAFNVRRADLLEKIADAAGTDADRAMWLRQLADTVSAAVQSGTYPGGAKRLEAVFSKLARTQTDEDLAGYVRFRQLTAEYGLALQAPKADFAKIQTDWLKNLKQYVADYPSSPDSAEAMLQLAIAEEFAGQEDDAKKWYARIATTFADSPAAKKAAGARTRLDSVGKTIRLMGTSPSGSPIDLAKYRGRVVLIQYWATWCEPALRDMSVLKDLVKKHAGKFSVIGVSLNANRAELDAYLAENKLPWQQIYEEGGLDSRPANQLGILTLPTMILVDQSGKVVNRNAQASELDRELKNLIR